MNKFANGSRKLQVFLFFAFVGAASSFAASEARPGWFGFAFSYYPPKADGKTDVGWMMVQGVAPRSPAAEAGLLPRDMITRFDGKPIRFANELAVLDYLKTIKPGQQVKVTVRRAEQTHAFTITTRAMTDEQYAMFRRNYELVKRKDIRPPP